MPAKRLPTGNVGVPAAFTDAIRRQDQPWNNNEEIQKPCALLNPAASEPHQAKLGPQIETWRIRKGTMRPSEIGVKVQGVNHNTDEWKGKHRRQRLHRVWNFARPLSTIWKTTENLSGLARDRLKGSTGPIWDELEVYNWNLRERKTNWGAWKWSQEIIG